MVEYRPVALSPHASPTPSSAPASTPASSEAATTTLRGYVNDLIAAHRHVLEATKRHPSESAIHAVPGASDNLARICQLLEDNITALEVRVTAMGGQGAAGHIKETVTTVTGFLAGLYGQARGETASRMLRDDYTALHFLMICTVMLNTTARAFGDVATVQTTNSMLRAFPPMLMRLGDLVPTAVVAELAKVQARVYPSAASDTIEEVRGIWSHTSRT